MCIYCCEHNEGASCFYRRIFSKCSGRLEHIEYVPQYGMVMPGVMTSNGIAILIYNSLSDIDKMEFIEYVKQTLSKERYESFMELTRN